MRDWLLQMELATLEAAYALLLRAALSGRFNSGLKLGGEGGAD